MEQEKEKSRLEQEFQKREKGQLVRLNKFISESGLCSRREADRLESRPVVSW